MFLHLPFWGRCSMAYEILVPWPGIEPGSSTMNALSPSLSGTFNCWVFYPFYCSCKWEFPPLYFLPYRASWLKWLVNIKTVIFCGWNLFPEMNALYYFICCSFSGFAGVQSYLLWIVIIHLLLDFYQVSFNNCAC